MPEPSISAGLRARLVLKMIITYQTMAISTESSRIFPMLRGGTFISSAAWGITSKPMNMKGVITAMARMPLNPF